MGRCGRSPAAVEPQALHRAEFDGIVQQVEARHLPEAAPATQRAAPGEAAVPGRADRAGDPGEQGHCGDVNRRAAVHPAADEHASGPPCAHSQASISAATKAAWRSIPAGNRASCCSASDKWPSISCGLSSRTWSPHTNMSAQASIWTPPLRLGQSLTRPSRSTMSDVGRNAAAGRLFQSSFLPGRRPPGLGGTLVGRARARARPARDSRDRWRTRSATAAAP